MRETPDIFEHANKKLAAMDADFVRGGAKVTANLQTLLTDFTGYADQLKDNVTQVWVISEQAYYRLKSKDKIANPQDGWDGALRVPGGVQSSLPYGTVLNYEPTRRPKLNYNEKIRVVPDATTGVTTEFGSCLYLPAGSTDPGARPIYGGQTVLENGAYNYTFFARISDNTKPGNFLYVDISEGGAPASRGSFVNKIVKYSDFNNVTTQWTPVSLNFVARKGYTYEFRIDICNPNTNSNSGVRYPTTVDFWYDYGVISPSFTGEKNPVITVNGKAGNVVLTASDLGLMDSTFVSLSYNSTTNIYSGNLSPAITAYTQGLTVTVRVPAANNAINTQLALNGLASVQIYKGNGTSLEIGDLQPGYYAVIYGANAAFYLQGATFQAASDAETQATGTVGANSTKFISPLRLFNWWNWLKGTAQNITSKWTFSAIRFNPTAGLTGVLDGDLWAAGTDLNFRDSGFNNKLLKKQNNFDYQGATTRILAATAAGDLVASNELGDLFVVDSDLIVAITGATYSNGTATITPANSKVLQPGQFYQSGNYLYLCVLDNYVFRIQGA